jgi:hypothetical protein
MAYNMKNNEMFSIYCANILTDLFDAFPLAIPLSIEEHVGSVSLVDVERPQIVEETTMGRHRMGVFVGPAIPLRPLGPFDFLGSRLPSAADLAADEEYDLKIKNIRDKFDWGQLVITTRALIERDLTEAERDTLVNTGYRPYTPTELEVIERWELEVDNYFETRDDLEKKKNIYKGTLKFLVNEEYIRIVDGNAISVLNGDSFDKAISLMPERLSFVVTEKAYIGLSKKLPSSKLTVYEGMIRFGSGKGLDFSKGVFGMTAAEITVTSFMGQFFGG